MIAFVLALALLQAAPGVSEQPVWPPETSVRTPLNALEYPTALEPVNLSLADLLNTGGRVVAAHLGDKGPVVTLRRRGKVIVCLVAGPNPATDQNVPTSRCYALN